MRVQKLPPETMLTPSAKQLAKTLGVLPNLQRLQELSEHGKRKRGQLSPEGATLRLEVLETIVTTMLQSQQVIVEIDAEISEANEFMAAMSDKRDRAIKLNSLASLVANGVVSTAGNFLQMPQTINEQPGEVLETGASGLSGGLGALALYQQNGDKLSGGIRPTMLAKIFKRPNNEATEYPDVIWTYLNTVPANSQIAITRREHLIENWEKLGRLPSTTTPEGRKYIRVLAGTIPQQKTITISMLDDRAAMLADLRAEVGQVYKELLNLMLVVRAL